MLDIATSRSPSLAIDGIEINDDSECYVIAEIGHNHQGKLEQCKQMFKAAKDCGAHAVKLQKRDNKALFTKEMYNSVYNSENAYAETYGAHREFLEFGREAYIELQAYAKELDITFFSTAFDRSSADFLADLDMPAYKIASSDITNIPLIKHVASFGKPMVISTGACSMLDVERAYEAVMPINPQVCIMQCTSGYPPEWSELNLRVIDTFRHAFPDIVIGFSAHDNGIAMPLVAYMLGARMVEKHFTLNRAWKGTDQAFSLEPTGLRKMVRDLQRTRIALGDGRKQRYPSEEKPLFKMAKKLVAARDLPAGHTIALEDVAIKVPNDGLPPYEIERVIGRTLKSPMVEDQSFTFENLG
jgi:N-acetylneuraminate synthase/sialic acid synthase